jgi:protein RecA
MGESADKVIEMLKAQKYKGATIALGDDKKLKKERIPFGIDLLDDLTSGGISYGRMTLVYGAGSVGKTFLMQKLIANAQKLGKSIIYVGIDKSFEPDWWVTVGVDISDLTVVIPNYGEQAWDMIHAAMAGGVDLVILDSADAVVPTAEADASMEESSYGMEQAKCNTRGIRKAQRLNNNTAFIILNHLREGIGKWASKSIPGGHAQEDFASLMLWVARGPKIEEAGKKAGFTMRVTVEKDKIGGKQYKSVEMPFIYEGGVLDSVGGLISLCLEASIIKQERGAHYLFLDQDIYGKPGLKEYIEKNPEVQEHLKKLLLESRK